MIVGSEQLDVSVQRGFIEHDHMIETLAPKRADQSFDIGSLPGRSRSRKHFLDSRRLHLCNEITSEDAVSITQQISRSRVPGKYFPQLLRGPFCGRMEARVDREAPDSSEGLAGMAAMEAP